MFIPPPAVSPVSGIQRVESIKALGITISRKFSVAQHVDKVLGASAQTLFALRTLRYYGLPEEAIFAVYQAVVVAKLSCASPAGGDSPVRLIVVESKRSFGDRRVSHFVQPRHHRSTLYKPLPMLNCLTISYTIVKIYNLFFFLQRVTLITLCVIGHIDFIDHSLIGAQRKQLFQCVSYTQDIHSNQTYFLK